MKQAVSRELYRYWDALRAGRTAPERSDVDPGAIRHLLANTFVLGVAHGGVRGEREVDFRLSGTRIDALFGRDLRGRAFADLWSGADGSIAESILDGVLDGRCAVVAAARGGPSACRAIDFELLLLPLRHRGETHTRILGSLAAATVPSWAGLQAVVSLELTAFRTLPSRPTGTGFGRAATPPRSTEGAAPARVAGSALAAAPPVGSPRDAPAHAGGEPVQVGPFRVYEGGRPGRRPVLAGT